MDSELKKLEEDLKGFAPSPLSREVLARMVQAMDNWEDSESDSVAEESQSGKVIAFPAEQQRRGGWSPMWAAAAAVAILGALIGVFVPNTHGVSVASMKGVGPVPLLRQASFVPVDVQRRVSSLDAGVIADKEGQPYQLIRVVRQEEANFRGVDNVGMKISRPKVDYYVVPVSY